MRFSAPVHRLAAALCTSVGAMRAAAQRTPAIDTATYASPALQSLVDAAARDNRVPPTLTGYRADVESEVALAVRRDDGVEAVLGVEQVASTVRWSAAGRYEQHVVGYRAQQAAPSVSLLTALPNGWVIPVLYGERLFAPREPAGQGRRARTRTRPLVAVHPLARDRERYYRYSGGDTVVTLRVDTGGGTRSVPIVRVHVEPRGRAASDAFLFLGDVELDAVRHVVVRMRGHYVVPTAPSGGVRQRLVRAAVQAYMFVELETGERAGAYWLPSYQRVEFQGVVTAFGDARGIVRIVSRLRDVVPNDTGLVAAGPGPRWRLTRAAGDTIDAYARWRLPLGAAAGGVHADDFDDVAPEAWRRDGTPRLEFHVARGSDIVRFDRIEGLYTGAGARLRLRDAAPGVTLRAAGGWAWSEHTARGRAEVEREWVDTARARGTDVRTPARWTATLRALRTLDLTNDFRDALDSGSSLAALLGSVDDYDYVDRRQVALAVRRAWAGRAAIVRVESGLADDGRTVAHVARGLTGSRPFRPNRGVDAGRYARTTATLELHPDVAAEFVRPGLGARLSYERGDGDLTYQRSEARLVGRVELPVPWPAGLRGSSLVAVARGDAGLVTGRTIPAQQLFELGGIQSLGGYPYKAFAGDRAALVRGTLLYATPWLRAPMAFGRVLIPGVAPSLSIGVETGGTWATSDAARSAIARLAPADTVSVARPSEGWRATVGAGVRLFGGALFVGAARPVDRFHDRRAGWRFVFGTAVGAVP